MIVKYKFSDGTESEVEVNEVIGEVILESRRMEENLSRKERYHCYSYDAADYESTEYADKNTPEKEVISEMESEHIRNAFADLSDLHRRRLLMYADGMTIREIAALENIAVSSVWYSIETARKKFIKNFEK